MIVNLNLIVIFNGNFWSQFKCESRVDCQFQVDCWSQVNWWPQVNCQSQAKHWYIVNCHKIDCQSQDDCQSSQGESIISRLSISNGLPISN